MRIRHLANRMMEKLAKLREGNIFIPFVMPMLS